MDIYHVSPKSVKVTTKWSARDISVQSDRLEKEGQIEPIPVIRDEDGTYTLDVDNPDFWHYSGAQVEAAKLLEWDTILVTY